jgi:putative oxidoreductase
MLLNEQTVVGPGALKVLGVARIVMGGCFMYYGISKLWAINGIIAFIGSKLPMPTVVFWLAVVIETGFGLMLVLGYKVRWPAAFLAFYCVFTALVFHTNFASMPIRDHFFANLVMAAAFLFLAATGPGAWALDTEASAS